MPRNFLIVDFEFTMYTRPVGRPRDFFPEIIEIGAVKLTADGKGNQGEIQNFVKVHFFPRHAQEAMDFCMITPADMKKAIPFKDMVDKLSDLYVPGETYFVAWGTEDYRVLKLGCEKHRIPNPILHEDYLDIGEAYKIYKGDQQTPGLKRATEELDVDSNGLWHTAYDDAQNTGKVLVKLLEKGWTPEQYFADKERIEQEKEAIKEAKHQAWLERNAKKIHK
ncbi:MAG: exonuclease domain-containing protein [Phascolarctobacterium sp.]|nr:exonuclease domain-containing protein [Phascolarctobacterium sp.]